MGFPIILPHQAKKAVGAEQNGRKATTMSSTTMTLTQGQRRPPANFAGVKKITKPNTPRKISVLAASKNCGDVKRKSPNSSNQPTIASPSHRKPDKIHSNKMNRTVKNSKVPKVIKGLGAEEMLVTFLRNQGKPPPEFSACEVFHVKCTVRDREFSAVYNSEQDAKNMAALRALEFLFGSKFDI